VLAVGYMMPLLYLLISLKVGKIAGPNPWAASGLEWETASPPPTHNFLDTKIVTSGPYDYELQEHADMHREVQEQGIV
jgi:cytochrome c oxidase subunit 1